MTTDSCWNKPLCRLMTVGMKAFPKLNKLKKIHVIKNVKVIQFVMKNFVLNWTGMQIEVLSFAVPDFWTPLYLCSTRFSQK